MEEYARSALKILALQIGTTVAKFCLILVPSLTKLRTLQQAIHVVANSFA